MPNGLPIHQFMRTSLRRGALLALLVSAACARSQGPTVAPIPSTMLEPWTTQPGDQIKVNGALDYQEWEGKENKKGRKHEIAGFEYAMVRAGRNHSA